MSWRRWQFWLFAGILSYAVIPVVEELLFRGYYQRRLAEDWGDGPAILAVACLFTLSHKQYLIANLYNATMILSLFFSCGRAGNRVRLEAIADPFHDCSCDHQCAHDSTLAGGSAGRVRGCHLFCVGWRVFSRKTVLRQDADHRRCPADHPAGSLRRRCESPFQHDRVAIGMLVIALGLEAVDQREKANDGNPLTRA